MLVDKVALGRRIKTMRHNLGMTQEEFAEQLNCTNSHLGKIENGKGGISIELLVSVANMLHTTVDQLCWIPMTIRSRSSCATFMSALINSL
mgnify:CR=1 FL=1